MEGLIEWIDSTAFTNILLCMVLYTLFMIARAMDTSRLLLDEIKGEVNVIAANTNPEPYDHDELGAL